jgi:hypothetical protein
MAIEHNDSNSYYTLATCLKWDLQGYCAVDYLVNLVNTCTKRPGVNSTDEIPLKKPIILRCDDISYDELSKQGCCRSINFIDSSIWFRYADKTNFSVIEAEIKEYQSRGLYTTTNAQEKCEINSRLAQNSYLNGTHSGYVVPFVFHSETEMHKLARYEVDKIAKLTKPLKWRFLLIDDHVTFESAKVATDVLPKCQIIQSVLSEYFNLECCKGNECECHKICSKWNHTDHAGKAKKPLCENVTIYLDCVTKIEDIKDNEGKTTEEGAISKIRKTKYDIILLDYLLGYEKPSQRSYAIDFLKKIKEFCLNGEYEKPDKLIDWKRIKGPNGAFRIFFISAFTNAVNERMLAEGMNFTEDYWHISRGACPTTTPHLFSYYLLKAMNEQIRKMSNKENIVTLFDLLTDVYDSKEKQPREQAIQKFNELLKMRTRYDDLKYDACLDIDNEQLIEDSNKSKLVNSLFIDIKYYDNALWEHVIHLVYLTAYGTIRQWHDMWEEFMLIKPYLKRAGKEKAEQVIKGIEGYITTLQTESRGS